MESVMNPTISSSQQSTLLLLPSIFPSIRVFSNESVLHIRWYMLLLLLNLFSCVRFCVTPQMAAHLAPPSLGFSRQEYWSGLPFPSAMHAWMLSRFSRVWLYVNPWTAAHQMVHSHMHMRTGLFVSYHLLTHTSSFSFLFSSVTLSCPTLCDPMKHSTPVLPVLQLPESTQIHVQWVGDTNHPPHPLSFPCPLTLNLSQHQGLFKWFSSLHQVSKVLEFQLQHQSFQWIFRTYFL